jgi:hypothetical protein
VDFARIPTRDFRTAYISIAALREYVKGFGITVSTTLPQFFEIEPCCRSIPDALLRLDSDARVRGLVDFGWYKNQRECSAGELRGDIQEGIDRRAKGWLYFEEALHLLAKQNGLNAFAAEKLKEAMFHDAALPDDHRYKLITRDSWANQPLQELKSVKVTALLKKADVNSWLAAKGVDYRLNGAGDDQGCAVTSEAGATYSEQVFLDICGQDRAELLEAYAVKPNGLWVLDAPAGLTRGGRDIWEWHPLRNREVPALPFPFTASQLAAFMWAGNGHGILEKFLIYVASKAEADQGLHFCALGEPALAELGPNGGRV